jgi:hypothetical protein
MIITPAALDSMAEAIAIGLQNAYPHNTWLVIPDYLWPITGGYAFTVLTRPWNGGVVTTSDYGAGLVSSIPTPAQGALPVLMAHPVVPDIQDDTDRAVLGIISELIATFAGNPTQVLPAGPLPPPHQWGG